MAGSRALGELSRVVLVLAFGACSPAENPPQGVGASAGTSNGSSGAHPGDNGGSASGGGDVATVGGAGAASGVAGGPGPAPSAGAGSGGGSGGAAGSSTGGVAGSSPASTTGIQSDPGTEGDGTVDQPPPYDLQPEALGHVNGAPQGQLLGPTIYTQKGQYDNWDQWKFTYWVYVPAQYKPGHAAAIHIFQDGLKYNGDQVATPSRFNTPTVFDNLIAEGSMPVTIGVFIDPGTNDGHHVGGGDGGRSRQYDTANDQYGKFLFTEFIPSEITSKYDIVTDADGWAMSGHSSGGNASISAAWFYPDKIHKVLTASATMGLTGGVFPGAFANAPAKPLRIYHMAGSKDDAGVYPENNQLAQTLKAKGYHYRYRPGQDVHYPPSAAASDFPNALRWLWRGYKAGL